MKRQVINGLQQGKEGKHPAVHSDIHLPRAAAVPTSTQIKMHQFNIDSYTVEYGFNRFLSVLSATIAVIGDEMRD